MVASGVISELCWVEARSTSITTPIPDAVIVKPDGRGCGKYETVWVIMACADHEDSWKTTARLLHDTACVATLPVPSHYQFV